MFKTDKKQENAEKKLEEILTWATEAVPTSINLWTLRLKHYLTTNQEEVADSTFEKVKSSTQLFACIAIKYIHSFTFTFCYRL